MKGWTLMLTEKPSAGGTGNGMEEQGYRVWRRPNKESPWMLPTPRVFERCSQAFSYGRELLGDVRVLEADAVPVKSDPASAESVRQANAI